MTLRTGRRRPSPILSSITSATVSSDVLAKLLELAPDPTMVVDQEGKIAFANSQAAKLFGYTRKQLIGRLVESLMPERFRARHAQQRTAYFANPRPRHMAAALDLLGLRSDGTEVPLDISLSPIPTDDDFLVLCALRDITERQRLEEALRQSEERYRTLFEKSVDGIAILIDGKIVFANPRLEEMLGYSQEELRNCDPLELVHPDDRLRAAERMASLMQDGEQCRTEYQALRKDGSSLAVEVLTRRIQYDGQSALLSQARDISERRRLEEALRRSEERLRTTLDGMLEGCQIIGFDWRYLYVNDAVARHGRRTKEELLGRTMMEMYPGIDETEMFGYLRRCMEERIPHRMENEFTYPDGAKGWFGLSIQPVPEGIFILSLDISERKRMEEALQRAREELEGKVERRMRRGSPYGLTFRELTVLHLVAAGRTDKEIGAELGISPLTVHKHVSSILLKMDASCRTEAGVRALREGLLE